MNIRHFLKYLQKKFPYCYRIYCKIRYPDPWGRIANLKEHIQIQYRKILYGLHFDKYHSQMQKIQALRDTHKGERCFVVGTGASLTYKDLERIKGEYSFSSNSIILAYPHTSWRPDCYGVVDAFGYETDISKYSTEKLTDYAKEFIFLNAKIKKNAKNSKENNIIHLLVNTANHRSNRLKKKQFLQEQELSICFYDCFTVTNMLLMCAMYMGFKEVYLLGVDCDYSGERMHIEETLADQIRKKDASHLRPRPDRMIDGYQLMKKIAEKKHCIIYNATRGGKLEVFPRVDIEEILGGNKR